MNETETDLLDGLSPASVEVHPVVASYLQDSFWPAAGVLAAHVLRGIEEAGYRLVPIAPEDE